ncbi:MAG: response regulator [Flavobacteriales bacterium]|nr:response regulator [Flavobacteriales bacterium]MCB9168417.1 response regulator [Flavobacteriales bacterium]
MVILLLVSVRYPVQLEAQSPEETGRSGDRVERVRWWCGQLAGRANDPMLLLQDPDLRRELADTARDATLAWLLAGAVERSQGRLDRVRILLDRAERSLGPNDDERIRASLLLDQAGLLSVTGDQATATRKYYAVLPVLQRQGPASDLSTAYIGLAFIFRYQREFEDALDYYAKAGALADSIGDTFTRIAALRGRAGILMEGDSIHVAERLYRKALALSDAPRMDAVIHTELANVSIARREYAKALPDFLAALEQFESSHNLTWASYLCSRIADAQLQLGHLTEARAFGLKGLKIADAHALRKELLDNLDVLPKACAALGLWEEALRYSKAYATTEDSLRNDVISTELARLEVEQQEQRDSLARAEQEEREQLLYEAGVAKASDERDLLLMLSAGVLVIVVGLWQRLRRMRRTRLEVAQGNTAIRREKLRAERSERVKDQFLANMSHEIRTPMNAIMGMTATLKRTAHLPEQERYLNAIAQSSDNLLVILNDILDLGRLEEGDIVLEAVPFDVRKVVDDVLDILRFRAEEKHLYLRGHVDDDVPPLVIGDPARLNQVLLNLVGNGIKFTERGGVEVRVSVERVDKGSAHLHYRIADTGIGIAPERQEQIFEEFTQAYSDTTRKYGGTGLGLTITKRLVELQNGTVSVESARDRGSTFHLDIPYPVATPDAVIRDIGPIHGPVRLEGLRILLAEDNAFNVMVARDELEDMFPGVRIEVVGNGRLAVERVEQADHDLVLMDIQMPEMNGFQATAAIRALGGSKGRIPILAMTANVLESEVERSVQAGMDGFVPKPFRRSELLEKITQALAGRR